MAREVVAHVRFPSRVERELGTEPDRHAPVGPPLGRLAHVPLTVLEGRVPIRGIARIEVDVVGDRDLRDATLDRELNSADKRLTMTIQKRVGAALRNMRDRGLAVSAQGKAGMLLWGLRG